MNYREYYPIHLFLRCCCLSCMCTRAICTRCTPQLRCAVGGMRGDSAPLTALPFNIVVASSSSSMPTHQSRRHQQQHYTHLDMAALIMVTALRENSDTSAKTHCMQTVTQKPLFHEDNDKSPSSHCRQESQKTAD